MYPNRSLRALGSSGRRATRSPGDAMPICKMCDDEVDELESVKIHGKRMKLCEDCADRAREEAEIAEMSESVVQDMMGFKGRR